MNFLLGAKCVCTIPSGNYFSIFALRRRSPANRRRFADDRRLSSIFAVVSPSFRRRFRAKSGQNVKNFRTIRFIIILPSNMPGTGIRTIYLGITPSTNLT